MLSQESPCTLTYSHRHANIVTPGLKKNADFGAELERKWIVHVVPCEFISVVTYCRFLEEKVPADLARKEQARRSHSATLAENCSEGAVERCWYEFCSPSH